MVVSISDHGFMISDDKEITTTGLSSGESYVLIIGDHGVWSNEVKTVPSNYIYNLGSGGTNPYGIIDYDLIYNFMLQNAQDFLNKLGFDCGTANGLWGSDTKAQMQAFQSYEGIPVTEMLDSYTYNRLRDSWVIDYTERRITDLASLSKSEEFWVDKLDTFIFPFRVLHTNNPSSGNAPFGAYRSVRNRKHGGIDYIQAEGHPVYSMADGEIVRVYGFYEGTFGIAIRNTDETLTFYGELWPDADLPGLDEDRTATKIDGDWIYSTHVGCSGQAVTKGQLLGRIKESYPGYIMLHLEVYTNESEYWITSEGHTNHQSLRSGYVYVTDGAYEKRLDLLDPTMSRYLNVNVNE